VGVVLGTALVGLVELVSLFFLAGIGFRSKAVEDVESAKRRTWTIS
jgi:hypothetical protein